MYDIERYLSIRSAYGASLSPDGERLAFLLDTTGVPQVWTVDAPDAWPRQLTFGEERVLYCSYAPERPELIFGRDAGGNECTQFYRLNPEKGRVSPLTDMPDAKHYWGGWANDSERFAFASNRRDESVFDIYVQSIDERGEEAERVYEGDTWLSPSGWSPGDDRLIVTESRSSFDQDLYILGLESGKLEHLTPNEGPVRYYSPEWGPDGDAIYCVTDFESDTLSLARIDAVEGRIDIVEPGGEWNVDGVAIEADSRRLVYSRNVEGYTELTVGELVDSTTIEPLSEPGLPRGVAGGVSFGPEGEQFAVAATARTLNTNIYLVDVETGQSERWTAAPTAGIPPDTFRGSDLVQISSFDDLEIPGFLTLPEQPDPGGAPVIIDIHGGPESQRRPSFSGVHQYFLAHGYAIFEPNVRGSSGYGKAYAHLDDVEKRMDSVADLAACAEWLAAHDAIDGDRLVAKGGSYGGFMVLSALTEYPDLWAAGIEIVGIANFVTFLEDTGSWRREHREAEYGSLATNREFLESISPINSIEAIRAPLFVIHGENDPRVPVAEARQIADAAGEHVPVETLIFADEGHGIAKLENRIEMYRDIVEFLEEYVRVE